MIVLHYEKPRQATTERSEITMSSQVVRVQGFSKGSLGAIGKEVEREEKDFLENRNEDIDKSRTHLNEFYKHTQNGMYGEWKDICKKLNVTNADNLKKNAIAFEGMVITSDQEYFKNLGYVQGQEPPEKVREFFDKSYEFVKQEIGFKGTDENILCASVHYDETTPHLQVYYVPVVDSWKEKVLKKDENGKVMKNEKGSPIQERDSKGKLVWKEVKDSEQRKLSRDSFWKNKGGNKSYTQMQDRYYEQISKEYGLGRGEKGSTREHTTKQEWEQKKLNQEIVAKRKELANVEKQTDKLKSELAYSKDGVVQVGLIATKEKTGEIERQNRALKREVGILQSENSKLKAENDKLKAEQKAQADALKDRTSQSRMALDALDRQRIYEDFTAKVRKKTDKYDILMKPYEDTVSKAHEVGKEMLMHKQGYVDCLERRKMAQNDLKTMQTYKSTLESDLGQIRALQSDIKESQNRIEQLQNEKESCNALQILKKRDCDKQIKELNETIKNKNDILLEKHGATDTVDLISWHENALSNCKDKIDRLSIKADNLTSEAQEHLKAYKITQQSLKAFTEPCRNIISRYDSEYTPPQDYKRELEPYSTQGLSRNKAQAKEDLQISLKDWNKIIDKAKADDILKTANKPKIKEKNQSIEWTR